MEQAGVKILPPLHPTIVWRTVCLGLLVGFVIGFWLEIIWWVSAVAFLAVVVLVWRRTIPILLGIFLFGLLGALSRGNGLVPAPPENSYLGEQRLTAQVVALPRLTERTRRYVVAPVNTSDDFRILVVSSPWPEYSFGDVLLLDCPNMEIIDFKAYNHRGWWRECAFPRIELLGQNRQSLRYWLYNLRQQAGSRLRSLTPEPYATLATGMIWGDDSGLPTELVTDFRRTGTSHLLAVSGFNVMVLTKVLFWLFISLGLWRRQASLAVLVAVGLFIVFCGGEPSVVRAGVMGSVLLVGNLLARRANNFNLLAGTAAGMLLISPQLVADLGWQLSFAAMVGLAYLSPLLIKKFIWLPQVMGLRQVAAETLAAALVTTPIILVRISEVSAVTPLVNLLVAPVAALVYCFGLSALVLSSISFTLALVPVWFLSATLFYLTTVVSWFAVLPGAAVGAGFITWFSLAAVYLLLAWWLVRQDSPSTLKRKTI